ncbi:hypothetical protein [Streptomyces sp. NPDC004658]|uniref:hypothetical protein n=1 Tax=Streptomyces sp. NPDC004658 TaxID=3154672 RepID=UPI0033B8D5A4
MLQVAQGAAGRIGLLVSVDSGSSSDHLRLAGRLALDFGVVHATRRQRFAAAENYP